MPVVRPPDNFIRFFHPELVDFVGRFNRAASAPLDRSGSLTSWWRSWEENLRVGGSTSPLSQHLAGLAVDVVPGNWPAFVRSARAAGLVAVDEGDHVHVQLWPRGGLNARLGIPI